VRGLERCRCRNEGAGVGSWVAFYGAAGGGVRRDEVGDFGVECECGVDGVVWGVEFAPGKFFVRQCQVFDG
jgi:hypothetical protein